MTTHSTIKTAPYVFGALEEKWRSVWPAADLYRTGDDPDKPNIYILDFFPYPSGDGLSVGHCRNYVPTCVSARFHRMRGYNVLHPMGWDAFGLPAENYAIAHGIHPAETTRRFAANYKRQMELVECSYDWSREVNSTDPAFYRWTQWFFLLLFRRGLAYRARGSQWWCPSCHTILANEQVEDGRCWRCDSPVTKKELEQWYFKITAYAEQLLAGLETIDWPERIKTMQRQWIGRSEGAEVVFTIGDEPLPVFTTRPDTLYGATFLALAPEHPLVARITTPDRADEVATYAATARRMSDIDRAAADRAKTGVFTGATAAHPLTGAAVPVWVADYVLPGYGSGAVMGVPAHDGRDLAFARRYGLPVVAAVAQDSYPVPDAGGEWRVASGERPTNHQQPLTSDTAYEGEGVLINSGPYNGLTSAAATEQMTADLAARGLGRAHVAYRFRDWLISRQRYWGAPIPIIHCPACGAVPVPEEQLPVLLPEEVAFAPGEDGRSPLARVADWVNVSCPQCGGPAQRETDTMDGFACSSWYFLRFASPHEAERPFDPAAVRAWLPVNTYVGGAEHAVMHLLYARFWTKVMHDAGLIDFDEPFAQLRNQGMLLSPQDGQKMSKSRGNVVTPDEVVAAHGVDALRTYVLFLGPFDARALWDDRGIVGVDRFLERVWRLAQEFAGLPDGSYNDAFERDRHRVIKRVTADMERFRFNTAVAALMEYVNALYAAREQPVAAGQWREAIRTLALLLAPIAPFIAEEMWREELGEAESIHGAAWPVWDEALAAEEQTTIVVQVNGKLRDRLTADAGSDPTTLRQMALASERVRAAVGERPVRDVIVARRVVNVVTA